MKTKISSGSSVSFLKIFIIFFLLIAFVLTSSILLFLTYLGNSAGIEFDWSMVKTAAIVTFGNSLMLSLVITAGDMIRRNLTVEIPIRRIAEGAERIAAGDFSTRIRPGPDIYSEEGFNRIIYCFNDMAEELGGIETLRTDFISNVSHELKTPIAVINNYSTMLLEPGLTEEQRAEYAESIKSASRRLSDLITNILKLNKLENQQIYPESERFDLSEQLCECLLGFEDAWEKKNLGIETDIADGIMIEGSPELLSLVWNNLFSNAIKFTDDGGTVSVSASIGGQWAEVRVKDTGCGISPETGRHIFEKFYQGDTSHAAQGNGLGLALVKRVIDITGGEIAVSSKVGEGSTFTVRLRRAAPELS